MVNKLIKEINFALDNDLYFVALNTALTLPDICGKAEYPNISDSTPGKRYKKWYQEYIGQYEKPNDNVYNDGMPYLDDNTVYQLRCSLLHQGNPNVGKEKTGIDKFILTIESKNEFGVYTDASSMSLDVIPYKTYTVSVRRLCFILCQCASKYYEENKQKFNFFNYKIIDYDKYKR